MTDARNGPIWWWWLLPLAAVAMVLVVWVGEETEQGTAITVSFPDAHGLQVGDAVRYRGMQIGEVADMKLDNDQGISCRLLLQSGAEDLARQGSLFWIERPMLGIDGVAGLETVIAGRHVGVQPGTGATMRTFTGLAAPPVSDIEGLDGLEVIVQAGSRGGLQAGAPVRFRGFTVGRVLSVALARDASAVEARLLIRNGYIGLLRPESRFWRERGLKIEAGLFDGFNVEVDSVATLVRGGIAFATPSATGEPVLGGHRFMLHDQADPSWLNWRPGLPVGTAADLQGGIRLPLMRRASLAWQQGSWWRSDHRRNAWVVLVPDGYIGPVDVLQVPAGADASSVRFAIDGEEVALEAVQVDGPVALASASVPDVEPIDRREPQRPENCLVVRGDGQRQLVAAARWRPEQDQWAVDEGLAFASDWHGAAVLAESDGAVLGLLLVDEAGARIAPLVGEFVARSDAATP